MSVITDQDIEGGGLVKYHSGLISTNMGAGVVASITPPSGQKVRLDTVLASWSGGISLSIIINNKAVIGSKRNILQPINTGDWNIQSGTKSNAKGGTLSSLTGGVDEKIEIYSDQANGNLFYAYSFIG